MNFRTSKCTHGIKGMCINCMVNKNKTQNQKQVMVLSCKHPPNMKCLRCLPLSINNNKCKHPDYQKCKQCQNYLKYDKFSYYLQSLAGNCPHKKQCHKCTPPLSRKTFFIDKDCKKHLPYPQALCDACMAPTLTISSQSYSHVSRVIIKTQSIYKVLDTTKFGILLGHYEDSVVYIQQVYFPEQQQEDTNYINPNSLLDRDYLFRYFNLEQVGLLYSSRQITGLSLMLSSLFQERYQSIDEEHQISKFITMRLQKQGNDPHLQCFMVSDQFQAFHKNTILYEKQNNDDYFDLITARCQENLSVLPTFLRQGIQTDKIYFKQIIVWIPIFAEEIQYQQSLLYYPFFAIETQNLYHFHKYIEQPYESLQKYRNIQFLLHLQKLIGKQGVLIFLNDFYLESSEIYLMQKLKLLQKLQSQRLKQFQNPRLYRNKLSRNYDT